MARGTLRDRQGARGGLGRSMRNVSLGSHTPPGRCVPPGSQHWSRRAAGWVFTCPTLPCTLWENTGTKARKLVLAARRTLRNDQDSPSGLQMCMASVSPGLETLPGCCASLSAQLYSRRSAAGAAPETSLHCADHSIRFGFRKNRIQKTGFGRMISKKQDLI